MQETIFINYQPITESTAGSLWSFYPEVLECKDKKKKKKCCKSYKEDKRCKKCPMNS